MVTSATTFGIFVTLDAMYVEGLVHITELGGEYFKFDEHRQELRGERTGIRYAIGTRVRVQVSRVDLDGRKIDFRLVREGEELGVRAMKDKGVSSGGGGGGGNGAPTKASAKRSARNKSDAGGGERTARGERGERAERAEQRTEHRAERPERVEQALAVAPQSAMQAFRTAVKKAANKMKGRKPRR